MEGGGGGQLPAGIRQEGSGLVEESTQMFYGGDLVSIPPHVFRRVDGGYVEVPERPVSHVEPDGSVYTITRTVDGSPPASLKRALEKYQTIVGRLGIGTKTPKKTKKAKKTKNLPDAVYVFRTTPKPKATVLPGEAHVHFTHHKINKGAIQFTLFVDGVSQQSMILSSMGHCNFTTDETSYVFKMGTDPQGEIALVVQRFDAK
jgi:hypothetical protein